MTAVEVFKSTTQATNSGDYHKELFEMAQFFSSSAHFTIIDSYTNHYDSNKGGAPSYITKRWKGDPIDDDDPSQPGYKVWETYDDLNEDNAWIIVQCETQHPDLAGMGYSGLPKWQCKFQISGGSESFADPSDLSGVKYPKCHGDSNRFCHRFGPYGGWDLEDTTPDFDPASLPSSGHISTQNHMEYGDEGSTETRWLHIHADGVLIRISRWNESSYKFREVLCIIGDVIPVDIEHMPMPRCAIGNGAGYTGLLGENADGRFLAAGAYKTNVLDYETVENSTGGGIAFWDHNEELIQEPHTMDEKDHWEDSIINPYPPALELDLFPVIPIPYFTAGHWFSLPYVRKSFTLGSVLYDSKQWMSVVHGWGPLFVWDGSSSIY